MEFPYGLMTINKDVFYVCFFFSAGVGRTGSFIAIDSLMEQMETEKAVDVYGFVARMRKQRNYMVQTQVSTVEPPSYGHHGYRDSLVSH